MEKTKKAVAKEPSKNKKAQPEMAALPAKELVGYDEYDPYKIIRYPLSTEKSIKQIEFENKLVFVIDSRATKSDVKKAVEELFKVRVVKINLQNSFFGGKRAYVRLGPERLASDVSADLGLI